MRTKKYPVPLARHTSLHRSLGEIPAYLGTHSTPSPEPRDTWADMSLWARHCSSRKDKPGKETQGGQTYCIHAFISCIHFFIQIAVTIGVGAGVRVTGAVLDPLALTVLAAVLGQRVVTGTERILHPSPAGPRAVAPGTPWSPAAIYRSLKAPGT